MLSLKSVTILAERPTVAGAARGIVFDGRNAVTVAHARTPVRWWAGVPVEQTLDAPVAVPVDSIRQHQLRSRHLHVAPGHLHNGQGMRTEWAPAKGCDEALAMLPAQPGGAPDAEFELDLGELDRVVIAAAKQDMRGYLCGVLMDFDQGAIVGTDGNRLHVVRGVLPKRKGAQVIVPRAAAHWLLSSKDERAHVRCWGLGTPAARVLMACSDGFVFAHGLEGKYPDWARVMPDKEAREGALCTFDPIILSHAVENMGRLQALNGKSKVGVVCLDVASQRVFAGTGPNFHAVQLTQHRPAAAGVWPYFNAVYLQDLADSVDFGARWSFAGTAGGALRVDEGPFSAVLMAYRENIKPSAEAVEKAHQQGQEAAPEAPKAGEGAQVAPEPPKAPPQPAKPAPGPAAVGAMADQLRGKVVKLPTPSHPGRKIRVH